MNDLRNLRVLLGITQQVLADEIGLDVSSVWSVEQSKLPRRASVIKYTAGIVKVARRQAAENRRAAVESLLADVAGNMLASDIDISAISA